MSRAQKPAETSGKSIDQIKDMFREEGLGEELVALEESQRKGCNGRALHRPAIREGHAARRA
eukprot:2921518-Prorocentrum_lima.AAC.1